MFAESCGFTWQQCQGRLQHTRCLILDLKVGNPLFALTLSLKQGPHPQMSYVSFPGKLLRIITSHPILTHHRHATLLHLSTKVTQHVHIWYPMVARLKRLRTLHWAAVLNHRWAFNILTQWIGSVIGFFHAQGQDRPFGKSNAPCRWTIWHFQALVRTVRPQKLVKSFAAQNAAMSTCQVNQCRTAQSEQTILFQTAWSGSISGTSPLAAGMEQLPTEICGHNKSQLKFVDSQFKTGLVRVTEPSLGEANSGSGCTQLRATNLWSVSWLPRLCYQHKVQTERPRIVER